jgi:hypothetical protein
MGKDPKAPRKEGLNPFEKAERTTREAKSLADADLDAARKKTARLREERLAKEASEREAEPKPKKSKPTRRA